MKQIEFWNDEKSHKFYLCHDQTKTYFEFDKKDFEKLLVDLNIECKPNSKFLKIDAFALAEITRQLLELKVLKIILKKIK